MGRRRRLIIHAGTHKTGTTAIQRALGQQAEGLRQQGIHWPALNPNHAHHFVPRSVNNEVRWPALQRLLLRRKLRRAPRDCHTIVISSEKIYRYGFQFFEGVSQAGELPLARRRAFLQKLSHFLAGFDLSVLLYLRRVDDFAESLFKEQQFRKRYTGRYGFGSFLDQQSVLFDYAARVGELEELLGPVSVLSYDEANRTGLVEHFCEQIGASFPPLPAPRRRVRQGPPNRAAQLLMKLSERQEVPFETRRQLHAFALSPAWLEPEGPQPSLWPTEAAHRAFLAAHAQPQYADLFPPVDWPSIAHRELSEAEFQRYLDAFDSWRRSSAGVSPGLLEPGASAP